LVLEQLEHENPEVRGQAIHAAGELALSAARARLLRELDREEDEYVRSELIWALSQIGGEGIEEKFEQLLAKADDDEEVNLLEEALDMLNFTNDVVDFELMEVGLDHDHDLDNEDDEYDELKAFNDEEWLRYIDEDEDDLDGSLDDSYTLEDPDDEEDL